MPQFNRKEHWEEIYGNKRPDEVSWYQSTPAESLEFIRELDLPANAKIIDIGGGDSFLVDHLLDLGYRDITVLDISEKAIQKAQKRLGERAAKVKWIIGDVVEFQPEEKYDCWHDRAAFHFLTDESDIQQYLTTIRKHIKPSGYFILATFSEQGPEKCSGIRIRQYSERSVTALLKDHFKKMKCVIIDHKTPFDTVQNFIFCGFRRVL